MEFIKHSQDWGDMLTTYIFIPDMKSMIRVSKFSDDPEYACLSDFWVFPEMRGRGLGKALIEEGCSIYKGCIPYLKVNPSKTKLVKYYENLGFTKGEFDSEDNKLVMYRYEQN